MGSSFVGSNNSAAPTKNNNGGQNNEPKAVYVCQFSMMNIIKGRQPEKHPWSHRIRIRYQ